MSKLITKLIICLSVCFIAFFSTEKTEADEKLKPEEIISKHLDAIGSKEKRAENKNRVILSEVRMRGKTATASAVVYGKAVFFSAGEKNLWGMKLNSKNYPTDTFSFNGKDTKVAYVRPAVRSVLGEFIHSYKELLKEGLFGGALSTSWALLNNGLNRAKVTYEGTKNINGKETLVISYLLKAGSDLSIKMYFDKQTYRHMRTEYNRAISASQGPGVDFSAGQPAYRYQLVEDFSDFQDMGGLTLPGSYKLSYSFSTGATLQSIDFNFKVTNFSYNQQIDENSFNIE